MRASGGGRIRRLSTGLALFALPVLAALGPAGCAATPGGSAPGASGPPDWPSWKPTGSFPVETAPAVTPDASGVYPGCPITLAEAQAAVPEIARGPDVGIPFKNVSGDCQFWFASGRDPQGRPLGITFLVFDAEGQGVRMWDRVRTDPAFSSVTDVPGVGALALLTGHPGLVGITDLFAIRDQVGLHIIGPWGGLPAEQYVALAQAALARLVP